MKTTTIEALRYLDRLAEDARSARPYPAILVEALGRAARLDDLLTATTEALRYLDCLAEDARSARPYPAMLVEALGGAARLDDLRRRLQKQLTSGPKHDPARGQR